MTVPTTKPGLVLEADKIAEKYLLDQNGKWWQPWFGAWAPTTRHRVRFALRVGNHFSRVPDATGTSPLDREYHRLSIQGRVTAIKLPRQKT